MHLWGWCAICLCFNWPHNVSQKTLVRLHYPEFCCRHIIRGGLQQRITLEGLIIVHSSTFQCLVQVSRSLEYYGKMSLHCSVSAANLSTLTTVDLYHCLNETRKSNFRCQRTLDDLSWELLWILPLERLTYNLHDNNLEFIKNMATSFGWSGALWTETCFFYLFVLKLMSACLCVARLFLSFAFGFCFFFNLLSCLKE